MVDEVKHCVLDQHGGSLILCDSCYLRDERRYGWEHRANHGRKDGAGWSVASRARGRVVLTGSQQSGALPSPFLTRMMTGRSQHRSESGRLVDDGDVPSEHSVMVPTPRGASSLRAHASRTKPKWCCGFMDLFAVPKR